MCQRDAWRASCACDCHGAAHGPRIPYQPIWPYNPPRPAWHPRPPSYRPHYGYPPPPPPRYGPPHGYPPPYVVTGPPVRAPGPVV